VVISAGVYGSIIQLLLTAGIMMVFIVLHLRCHPYYTNALHKLDIVSQACILGYVYWSIYDYNDKDHGHGVIIFLLVVTQITFWLYFVVYLKVELLKFVLQRNVETFRKITCNRVDVEEFRKKHGY
jgi:hypothetical protein